MQTSPKLIHSSELQPEQLLLWRREWIQFSRILEVKRGLTGPGSSSASFWSRGAKTAGKWTQPCILLFFKHLCGSWAVCSVAPHWLKMSLSQWTQAFALSYCSTLKQLWTISFLLKWWKLIKKGERCGAGCWPTSWGNANRQPFFGPSCLLTRVGCHTESRVTRHLASNWRDEASAAPVAHFSHFLLGRVCMRRHIWECCQSGRSERSMRAAAPLLPLSPSCLSLPFSHNHQHLIFLFRIWFSRFPFVCMYKYLFFHHESEQVDVLETAQPFQEEREAFKPRDG